MAIICNIKNATNEFQKKYGSFERIVFRIFILIALSLLLPEFGSCDYLLWGNLTKSRILCK